MVQLFPTAHCQRFEPCTARPVPSRTYLSLSGEVMFSEIAVLYRPGREASFCTSSWSHYGGPPPFSQSKQSYSPTPPPNTVFMSLLWSHIIPVVLFVEDDSAPDSCTRDDGLSPAPFRFLNARRVDWPPAFLFLLPHYISSSSVSRDSSGSFPPIPSLLPSTPPVLFLPARQFP